MLFIKNLLHKKVQVQLWEFEEFMYWVSSAVMSEEEWKKWTEAGSTDIIAFKETVGKYLPPIYQFVSSHLSRLEMILNSIDKATNMNRLESVIEKVADINKRVTYIWFWLSSFHHYRTLKWMPQMIKKRTEKRITTLRNETKSQ